jgi:predicted DNA-binding transcriptional regulator YafY
MSRHLERLLQIDSLLRNRQRWTAATLADVLEMSERTVRSNLAFMRDRFSAPLEFNRKLGYHYIDSEWRLPSILLTNKN